MRINWVNVFLVVGVVFLFMNSSALADASGSGWSGDIFVGYNKSSGNTDKGSASLAAQALKKFEHSQFSLKGDIFYSESKKQMDGQKWDALGKYSLDFGSDYRFYNFYQVLVDHDYFADIDYRITPTAGLGYHISNTKDWVWDVDAGAGYRITRHRVDKDANNSAITGVAHTFMKKSLFDKAYLSEDMTVYPGLKSSAGMLLRSETVFANPLRDNLDLELKYIVDYNSKPAGKKKTDTQIIAGLKYKF